MSSFKDTYPDFAAIETHIARARAERSVHLAHVFAGWIETLCRSFRRFSDSLGVGLAAERGRRAVEADALLKRYVPRY